MRYELKVWPERFEKILANIHMTELRIKDREYNVGDEILLREWTHEKRYTGRVALVQITAINEPPWPPPNEVLEKIIKDTHKLHHLSSMRMRRKPVPETPEFVALEISLVDEGE